jgi:tRNA threonylcarbamoyladenosine biosynthesis protein TsaB
MNILAFDTSGETCSVALLMGKTCLQRIESRPRKQAEALLPMIDAILAEAGIGLTQLDGLALTRGPGAFTGVRIGIGVAQGMSYAADIPAVTVSTLAVIAQSAYRIHSVKQVLTAVDARMKEIYWGGYLLQEDAIMASIVADRLSAPEELQQQIDLNGDWSGVGSGWEAYASALPKYPIYPAVFPQAQDIITLAVPEFTAGRVLSAAEIIPVYLRDKVVDTPLTK